MPKDFLSWALIKETLENKEKTIYFSERDIFWCHFGQNIDYEQDGKHEVFTRPVIILKKISSKLFIGIPTSTKIKDTPYYFKFTIDGEERSAILSQIKAFSTKRLQRKISVIDTHSFECLKQEIYNSILK